MRQVAVLICGLFLLPCHTRAEDQAPKPDPVFRKAEESLRAALVDIDPRPSFEYPKHAKSLFVKYRTRKFMIHNGSMTGEYSEKAHEEEGPSYRGFMLKVHLQKAVAVNQAVVPQTLRRPYWRTDLNITTVDGTDQQFYWGLSYGNRVDQSHLKRIRSAINALGTTKRGNKAQRRTPVK